MGAGRRDVAVYAPAAAGFYERGGTDPGAGWGGAEVQVAMLSAELAIRGLRVAHVVHPVEDLRPGGVAGLEVIERQPHHGEGGIAGPRREFRAVWASLAEADAEVYVIRKGGGHVIPAVAFCRLHRRKFVLSASNDLDFVFDRPDRSHKVLAMYRRALRHVDAVVVQSQAQIEMARANVRPSTEVELIPSFAEAADPVTDSPDKFLWAGRLVDYKQPLRYLELARAVPEATFVMVGVPTSETSQELLSAVHAEANALPNVELLGAVPRSEILGLVERSAAIVSTSTYEGMPNVFLEAWARGVPALTLDFDPDGLVGDGLGTAAGNDFSRFVEGAKSLWRDPGLRAEYGEAARRYVLRAHDLGIVANLWERLIRRLLPEVD